MYTSYIGKKFLKIYNEKMHTDISAEEFFDRIFFNLFFNDERHLIHVSNSPFFQKPREEDVKKYGSKPLAQYNNLKTAIAGEMYASWIGEALAIGVSGGFAILLDEPDILWQLFCGWKYYRKYLNQTPNVKDKQIETWNGHWLSHWCRKFYNDLTPYKSFHIMLTESMGNLAIPTKPWLEIIMALSKKYPDKVITAYSYNLSQTNTTLGFINLYLPEVHSLFDFRDKLFFDGKQSILSDEEIESFNTYYNFKSACRLKAIEPDKLRQYFPIGSMPYAQGKEYKFNNEESYINYELYKIWIIAMINKTELLELATAVAKALIEFERTAEKGKTVYSNLSKEVRKSNKIEVFGQKLKEIMEYESSDNEVFRKAFVEAYYIPKDSFPLFMTLIDFEYTYWKSKN